MIEQRTLLKPGEGLVPAEEPTKVFKKYPMHMDHDGYQPGTVGQEVKSPHGFTYHLPGTAIRYPPVLVLNEDQEAQHAANGYHPKGPSDAAAFARAVATEAPRVVNHEPVQYPKWIASLGKEVKNAEEEAKALGLPAPAPPAPDTPVAVVEATSDDQEIADLEAKLVAAKAAKADKALRIARLKAELAAELAEGDDAPPAAPATSSEAHGAPAVDTEVNTLETFPALPQPPLVPPVAFREPAEPKLTPQQKRAATLARKKAEREVLLAPSTTNHDDEMKC